MDATQTGAAAPMRIDLLRIDDVAHWCRVFDLDMAELRRVVQQVGPQVEAVHAYLAKHRPTAH